LSHYTRKFFTSKPMPELAMPVWVKPRPRVGAVNPLTVLE
jgi:hypothetical protein